MPELFVPNVFSVATEGKEFRYGSVAMPVDLWGPWRLDDEKLVYPFYERIQKAGIKTVCIHKGLIPRDYEKSMPGIWKHATVDDVGQAAKDWPGLDFVIYHSGFRAFDLANGDELWRTWLPSGVKAAG